LINILLQAFSKFDSSEFDQNLEEIPEGHCSMTAGYTLESVAKTIGDEVLNPIFNFIQPKLTSLNWGDRYIAMIAFGSIIDGPSTEALFEIVG
jgi:importin subunit beta-1